MGKLFTSKFVGTGPSSYEKRIYRAAVSQRLRNTVLDTSREALGSTELCDSPYYELMLSWRPHALGHISYRTAGHLRRLRNVLFSDKKLSEVPL